MFYHCFRAAKDICLAVKIISSLLSILKSDGSGIAPIVVSNASFSTQVLQKGMRLLLLASLRWILDGIVEKCFNEPSMVEVAPVSSSEHITWRKQELRRIRSPRRP